MADRVLMEWLNYHHLLYFYMVAREGGVAQAAKKLHVTHPTVSAQTHALEDQLGERLFQKKGRTIALTHAGQVVYGYADQIFTVGKELLDTMRGRPTGRRPRVIVGIADVVPKLIAKRILDPVRRGADRTRLVCTEDSAERLLLALGNHELDAVISDAPLPSASTIRAYSHLLGECGLTLCATRDLAGRYQRGFPESLDGAPFLLPREATSVRRGFDQWLDANDIRPEIEAEFDDSALLKVFGQDGAGVFPVPSAIEAAVCSQYDVVVVGRVPEVRERFFLISPERRLRNPAVLAMTEDARRNLFGEATQA